MHISACSKRAIGTGVWSIPVDHIGNDRSGSKTQFRSMAGYLSWELAFTKAYSASAKGELAADKAAMDELRALGEGV